MTSSEPAADWAIVELMGYRRRAGRVSEVERFGAKLLRVDIPIDGAPEAGYVTEYYGGTAIYALRPCAEDVARAAAESFGDPRPVAPVQFRVARSDDSDDDRDDSLGDDQFHEDAAS